MSPADAMYVNWTMLVEKNAGFAIAFAILLIGGILAFTIIKIAAKQILTLQDLVANHMVHDLETQKELILSIREFRKESTETHNKMMDRHDKVLEGIYKIKGKLEA